MLLAVMNEGELRLYDVNEEAGQLDEWGRLRIAREMPHEALARFTMDLSRLAGANGHAPQAPVQAPQEAEEVVVHPHPSELEPVARGTIRNTVLAYVSAYPGHTAAQIGKATGYTTKQVANVLSQHSQDVKRIGADWYMREARDPKPAKPKAQGPTNMVQPHSMAVQLLILLVSSDRPTTADSLATAIGREYHAVQQSLARFAVKWPNVVQHLTMVNGTSLFTLTDYGRDTFVPGLAVIRQTDKRFASVADIEAAAAPEALSADSVPEPVVAASEQGRLGDLIARTGADVHALVSDDSQPVDLTRTDDLGGQGFSDPPVGPQ